MKQIPVGKKGSYAIVDDEDYEDLSQYTWSLKSSRKVGAKYAVRYWHEQDKMYYEFMHKRLTGFDLTDHINRNGLDNRRSNLRPATNSQNGANKEKQPGLFSSKYKGVSWDKSRNKWAAYIKINQIKKYLGRFNNELDAARAYDTAAVYYFGEYACLNLEEV